MWTAVVSSILLMTVIGSALSKGNYTSPTTNVKPLMLDFKRNVHQILEGARILKKRQLEDADSSNYKLKVVQSNPDDLPYLSSLNITFWISVHEKHKKQLLVGTIDGFLRLFELSYDNDKSATEIARSEVEDIAVMAKFFSFNEKQWFAVLHNSGGEYYIQMYQREGRGLEKSQKIDLSGFSDIELVTMKGIYYLVVASYSSKIGQSLSTQATVTLYFWAKTQFDAIASRMVYGARSVACWMLEGTLYIAVAQEIDDEGNLEIGSPVFLYNSKEEDRLVLWETLQTSGPSKIQHFYVANSHYLVVIGKQDAVIYWWSTGQFLKWQTLSHTAGATELSIITLGNGEVAIVIALQGQALLYTLDSSGLYIITLTIDLGGASLNSLQLIFSGRAYYALSILADKQSIYRLTIGPDYLPSVQSLDPFQQCLSDVQQLLKERRLELDLIKSDLGRVWLKGSNQTITSKVVVEGSIASNERSVVRDAIIVRYANIPDASMSQVIAALATMSDLAHGAKRDMDGAVTKSTRQEIRGMYRFLEHVFVPSLTMQSSSEDFTINGLPIYRLHDSALRKKGDQVFSAKTSVSNLYSETAKVANLNGILIDDFLLLHGIQTVSGILSFSTISAADAFVDYLNSIPIEDIITTNVPQNIESMKTFTSLKSNSIDVSGETNEVDLSSIRNKITFVDEHNEFGGQITFLSLLTVDGDLFLSQKINKFVDFEDLVQKTVKRGTDQDLTGQYVFRGKHTIYGDLLVKGLINKVSLDNLLTLSSHQKIYANMDFFAPVVIEGNLMVHEVNGVDLSEEVLSRSAPYQFITGRKTFAKDIQADFVDMTEYIRLDGVDPSFLVQDIVQHMLGVIEQSTTVLKDVEVLNTLNVLGDVNGIDVGTFSTSFWLKSKEQDITNDVTIQHLHSKQDMDVITVNGLNFESDFIHSFMDETIESEKTFTVKTVIQSMKNNGAINGIELKSYKVKLENFRNEWEIQGTKSMSSLGITGNLKVNKLNQLDATEIMRPDAEQIVSGPVEFEEVAIIRGNAKSGKISASVVNNLNLQEFFRSAVLSTQLYKPLMNKRFQHLRASNMTLPSSSTIAGVSLDELLKRAVTLREQQLITAQKIFANDLKFKKLINTNNLNGLKLNDYLNEVVMTDEASKISNKFLGNIQTEKASMSGLINGIKIEDLAADVFYKSEDNVISEHFIFDGDIDVGELFAPKVDAITWAELIFLQQDNILQEGWLMSNIRTEGDIFVAGSVNGCDLSQISNILYTNKSTQVIKKNLNVQNIFVIGDLIVRKTVNDVSLEDLKNLITISDDQIITSDVIIDASLKADNLDMSNIANVNLVYIMQDAVRHSVSEEIKGLKTFRDGVDITFLTTDSLFASKVNGVDLEELELTTVWKSGHQEIAGDKMLPSLLVNVAIVNGYLNGLKLPEDVIRADVSEHISHPTYLMSDVYVSTDVIAYGFIDGVDLNNLINQRITLRSNQNFTSALTFKDDVILFDDLNIDGTVNDIVLELVAKSKPIYPIQGYKIFREFHTLGSVTAFSVNQLDIVKLSNSILQFNKNEHITEVQIFESPVHVHNSMFVEWINNVPVHQLTTAFTALTNNLQSVLGYLHDLSHNLQRQLNLMMSASQDQVHKYAYFTLFQEINMGPTNRILYGYKIGHSDQTFSHSLVMWTQRKHCIFLEKCCHLEFSYWLRVTERGMVMIDGSPDPGRYYPVTDSSPTGSEKKFFMWTNSTEVQSEWCTNNNGRTILAVDNDGMQEVYLDIESSALLSEVKSFRKGNLYAVASFYYDPRNEEYGSTIVYTYTDERYWSEHRIIPSFGVLSLDLVTYTHGYEEDVLLALGTGMKPEPASYSSVYKWNGDSRTFDLVQNIPSQYVSNILWIQKGRDLLLSLASVDHWPNKVIDCGEQVSGGQIDIFSYKETHLKWIQSIPVKGVVSMVTFSVDGDTYLAAASIQYQTIYIFEWRGFSGFVQIQTISAEARHISIYHVDDDVYMTVASLSGPSKILKLVQKGKSTKTSQSFDLISSKQHDELPKKLLCY